MWGQALNAKLLVHAALLASPQGNSAVHGRDMGRITTIVDAAIAVEGERIVAVGTSAELLLRYNEGDYPRIDMSGRCIVPGFVDSHTHLVFAGYREDEFMSRLDGASYMEIMDKGGGIAKTVIQTRAASAKTLVGIGRSHLATILSMGVTTLEAKSGYGLDLDTELKQLAVQANLDAQQAIDVVSTFLGAHAIPPEFAGKEDAYIDFVIQSVLPEVIAQGVAKFCDVFCETGVFSVESSKRLLTAAKRMGLTPKIHADEMNSLGGTQLAVDLDAASADHLLAINDVSIRALANSSVVATVLPGTAFSLNKPFAPARKMIDAGCAVAIATDFNPGSCFSSSIPLAFALAGLKLGLSAEEALTALTLNGAAALGLASEIGSIEVGKIADFAVLTYPSYKFLMYHTAMNCVEWVFKRGKCVYGEEPELQSNVSKEGRTWQN